MSKIIKDKDRFVWGGVHPFSYHPLVFNFIPDLDGKVILDCGCGKGVWGFLIRTTRSLKQSKLVGIDLNKDYLIFCKKHNVYNKLINEDITRLSFKNKSVDVLLCSEVIEHMTKRKGEKFFAEIDRVIKDGGRAIITTPNVDMDTVGDGADAHHSRWQAKDLRKKGYKVYGMGIRFPIYYRRWYTRFLLGLGFAFTPVSYLFPNLGSFMIAVKDF